MTAYHLIRGAYLVHVLGQHIKWTQWCQKDQESHSTLLDLSYLDSKPVSFANGFTEL